jgi:hypothetical protein
METLFIVTYLWAGLTILKTILLFDKIVGRFGLEPFITNNIPAMLFMVVGWPIALIMWSVYDFLGRLKVRSNLAEDKSLHSRI